MYNYIKYVLDLNIPIYNYIKYDETVTLLKLLSLSESTNNSFWIINLKKIWKVFCVLENIFAFRKYEAWDGLNVTPIINNERRNTLPPTPGLKW